MQVDNLPASATNALKIISCELCPEKDSKLLALEELRQKLEEQLRRTQYDMESERESRKKLEAYRLELENNLSTVAADAKVQVSFFGNKEMLVQRSWFPYNII